MYVTVMPVSAIHGLGICVWFYPNKLMMMMMMMMTMTLYKNKDIFRTYS